MRTVQRVYTRADGTVVTKSYEYVCKPRPHKRVENPRKPGPKPAPVSDSDIASVEIMRLSVIGGWSPSRAAVMLCGAGTYQLKRLMKLYRA